jgi:hypothetical protein
MFTTYETAIIDRLKAKLPKDITITTIAELERVPELRGKTPAVLVVYQGFGPSQVSAPNVPHIQQVEHRWTVVAACKNARGNGAVIEAREDAGELAQKAVEALLGHQLGGGVRLTLTSAPAPEYDAGYAYIPIGFACRVTYKGEPA